MYHPDTTKPMLTQNNKKYFAEVTIYTIDGLELLGWYAKASNKKPTLAYFHGNAGNIANRVDNLQPFIDNGFGVLLLSYRGYGGNKGSPSEKGLYKDARAAIKFLLDQEIEISQIILFGESLGTGIAAQMATEYSTKMLILQSPYTSMAEVAATQYSIFPVTWLLKDRYDTISKIPTLKQKIIILHGLEDRVVPYYMSNKLHAVTKGGELFTDDNAGHGNILTKPMAEKIMKSINDIYI